MTLQQAITRYRSAVDAFACGDAGPAKWIFSHRDDVTLANPWGPAVRGWQQVCEALDRSAAKFKEGGVIGIETIALYESSDLATIIELERWKAKVSGRTELSSFELRVTSTFRYEDSAWKLVHRHADPITAPNPDGPLRRSGD